MAVGARIFERRGRQLRAQAVEATETGLDESGEHGPTEPRHESEITDHRFEGAMIDSAWARCRGFPSESGRRGSLG